MHKRKDQMSKKRAEYQKSTSCCHKAWLICRRRRRERPDFFHQGEAQRNILTISGIEQVRDAMRGHFILLEVKVDERWGDKEAVDHNTGLANSEVPAALHNVLGVLVSRYVVVANKEVHQAQVPKQFKELGIGVKRSVVCESGQSRSSTTFSIRSNTKERASYS